MHNQQQDIFFMQYALELAAMRRGFCAPNPSVGAVVVKDGVVIAEGVHWAHGQAHAELTALSKVEQLARGAILYVTLEPCSHFGKTPPCTDIIIRCQLAKVFYGMTDPNPRVKGGGFQILKEAGIPCELLPLPAVTEFYQSYRYWLKTGLPWVTAKLALSLDGKIAGACKRPLSLTGESCQAFTHQQRKQSDAILTTAVTIQADNPQLNVRQGQTVISKPLYVIDSSLSLFPQAQIFQTAQSITVFHRPEADPSKRQQLESVNVCCVAVDEQADGLNLNTVLRFIGQQGRHDLWLEAGGCCFSSFIRDNLAQTAYLYVAPKILGHSAIDAFSNLPENLSFNFESSDWQILGKDAVLKYNGFKEQ
jgi:diaminohydroxyphosphoribosylaminopyrimidine deaminase / 5-amino-6-(5-phosphoribosylamino)uracil reductase